MILNRALILFLFVFTTNSLQAQGEISNWFFGKGAGLTFNTNAGTVAATNAAQNTIDTEEGCSSISDENGQLLFYTDGRTIWDRNHQTMPNADYDNGTGLLGDPSSTCSALVVPMPYSDTQYYVFTVDEPHHQNADVHPNQFNGTYIEQGGREGTVPQDDNGYNDGINYSIVDMSLNGGNGDVVAAEKNKHLITYDTTGDDIKLKSSEKITAVEDDTCEGFWVISHFIDTFYAFKIDDKGINPTPVKSKTNYTVPTSGYRRNGLGYMKASPLGDKLAVCHIENKDVPGPDRETPGSFLIYDFDKITGIVSNERLLKDNVSAYGTEFSPDGSKVYMSDWGTTIYQFDINNNYAETNIGQNTSNSLALQLGPDGKIYAATYRNYLEVINNPNAVGNACNYVVNGVQLAANTTAEEGLPPFVTSFLIREVDIIKNGVSTTELNLCEGNNYTLECVFFSGATYEWTKTDNNGNVTVLPETDFDLVVSTPGIYEVKVVTKQGVCTRVRGKARVIIDPIDDASFTITPDCDNIAITITGTPNGTFELDPQVPGVTINAQTGEITGGTPGDTYTVKYTTNGTCPATSTQNVTLLATPIIQQPSPISLCEDESGRALFNLDSKVLEVLNGLPLNDHTITFHKSENDAKIPRNAIKNTTNYTSGTATVWVRVANGNCFSIVPLQLTLNPLPLVDIDDKYIKCEEDNEALVIDTGLNSNDYIFEWTKAGSAQILSSNSTYEPDSAGIYTVKVIHKDTKCEKSDTTEVIISKGPKVKAKVTSIQFAQKHTILATAIGDGIYEFSIDNGPWVSNQPNNGIYTFNNVAPGIHEIKVRDIYGCGEDSTTVIVLDYPPFFTPNEDTYNDTWNIYGIEWHPEAKIYIFNRYGKFLKQLSPTGEGWDGTLNGQLLPATDYWFTLEYIDDSTASVEKYRGHFALKR